MDSEMFYCPCCGKIIDNVLENDPVFCIFCNTQMINLNISSTTYWEKVKNHTVDEYNKYIRETLVKTNHLYDEEKFKSREYDEKHMQCDTPNLPKCPACGSTNIQKISTASKVGAGIVFGVFSLGHISKTFKCKNCGYKF